MRQEWKQWEGRTLNGRFPLKQFVGASDHSAVFVTERDGAKAAIKLIAANPADTERKLAQGQQAAGVSHPNLIPILETGQAKVEGADVWFVVMEYAEEDLSQILPQRALTPAEAREMLGPVLDVLSYLHGKGLVHGHLKPSNILATGDQVKVSSDRIVKAGEKLTGSGTLDAYDAPEKARGKNSPAGDVWALGVTLTEVLTRQLPRVNGKEGGEVKLPDGLASPYLDIARNCLWRDAEQRWSVNEIAARLGREIRKPTEKVPASAAPVVVAETKKPATAETAQPKSNRMWIAVALVAAAIVGGALVARRGSEQPAVSSTVKPTSSAPAAAVQPESPKAAEKPAEVASKPAAGGDKIVSRVLPNIPRSARDTITGKVKVRVRVEVDSEGKVSGTKFETRGPSEYFAREAKQAAERWEFAPSPEQGRRWDLLFEFGRGGTQVVPSRVHSR